MPTKQHISFFSFKLGSTALLVSMVFLSAVFVRSAIFFYQSGNWGEVFGAIALNGEVAHNILEGKGLVSDSSVLEAIRRLEKNLSRSIDSQDFNFPAQAHAEYKPIYNYEPGYPLFLALLWKIFGTQRYLYAIFFQIFLAGIAAVGVFWMARKFFSVSVSLLSAFLYAFYIPEAKILIWPHQYAWGGIIAIAMAWLLVGIGASKNLILRWMLAAALGIVGAVGAVMHSAMLFLPMVGVLYFFIVFKFRPAMVVALLMLGFFFMFVTPFILRNVSEFGEAKIATRPFWANIARGLGQFPNYWQFSASDSSIIRLLLKEHPEYLATEKGPFNPDSEEYLKQEIIARIKKNPVWYAGTIMERISMAIFPFHYAMIEGMPQEEIHNGNQEFYSLPLGPFKLFGTLAANVFTILGLAGMYLLRRQWRLTLPVLLIWFYFIGVYSVTVVHGYYLHGLSFVYALFGAYAISKGLVWLKLRFQ